MKTVLALFIQVTSLITYVLPVLPDPGIIGGNLLENTGFHIQAARDPFSKIAKLNSKNILWYNLGGERVGFTVMKQFYFRGKWSPGLSIVNGLEETFLCQLFSNHSKNLLLFLELLVHH